MSATDLSFVQQASGTSFTGPGPDEDGSQMVAAARRRPHLLTETLAENEELERKNEELEAENRRLHEKIAELKAKLRRAEQDISLSGMGRTRSQRSSGGSVGSEKEIKNGGYADRRRGVSFGDVLIADESRPMESLLVDLEGQEAENMRLHATIEEAMSERKTLQESTKSLQRELAKERDANVQHEATMQGLLRYVEEVEDELAKVRESRDSAATGLDAEISAAFSPQGGGDSLACELHQSPVVDTKAQILLGHLQKRAPYMFRQISRYQRRFVAVENGKMTWWSKACDYPAMAKCGGSVDFSINRCVVEADPDNADGFIIRPLERVRVSQFTPEADANGVYNIAEFRSDPALRYKKEDAGTPMFIFWGDNRWYIGPDSNFSSALATKPGPDTHDALSDSSKSWVMHKFSEHGQVQVSSESAWVAGSFTGAHTGRILEWSVNGSEHTRSDWLHGLRQQVELCKNKRVSLSQLERSGLVGMAHGPMANKP